MPIHAIFESSNSKPRIKRCSSAFKNSNSCSQSFKSASTNWNARPHAKPLRFVGKTSTKKTPPDQHKRPGRPEGHAPAFRPPPQQIDDDIEMRLDQCPRCGGPVIAVERCEQYIEDIPAV